MDPKLDQLKERLQEINDLEMAAALLNWDQSTYMPPEGGPARGRQIATLTRLAHEKFTDPAIGELVEALRPLEEQQPYDSDEASLIRFTRREYEHAVRIPPAFVAELSSHVAESYEVWARARPDNNFAATQSHLEKTVELSRQLANYFPGYAHIADPLIDFSDYGMTVASIKTIFGELRQQLVPLVQSITAQPVADDSCLRRSYPEDQQLAFGLEVIKRFGYDLQRGRQDKTHHPFMTKFSLGDVRITTRVREQDLSEALFSTMHEAGHALYEQGIARHLEGTPLAGGASSGVHESQSRLWENLVGRSRPFWEHFYPSLQQTFPAQLGEVPLDTFYRAINKVQRSLIRTDADEVTYNLHIMMRFDFELDLLEGKLAVKDLPEAWRERFKADFGIVPPDDRDGVMQDVHWFAGTVGGAFQGYALGNILSAQIYDAALVSHPGITAEIGAGSFDTLHTWLRDNLYCHGRKFAVPELIERATGRPLSIEPYIGYLRRKYGQLYEL